jgi:hypothetical protein
MTHPDHQLGHPPLHIAPSSLSLSPPHRCRHMHTHTHTLSLPLSLPHRCRLALTTAQMERLRSLTRASCLQVLFDYIYVCVCVLVDGWLNIDVCVLVCVASRVFTHDIRSGGNNQSSTNNPPTHPQTSTKHQPPIPNPKRPLTAPAPSRGQNSQTTHCGAGARERGGGPR